MYSLNTFTRRFGGWRKALEAFLDYIEVSEYVGDEYVEEKKENNIQKRSDKVEIKKRKTPRDINFVTTDTSQEKLKTVRSSSI